MANDSFLTNEEVTHSDVEAEKIRGSSPTKNKSEGKKGRNNRIYSFFSFFKFFSSSLHEFLAQTIHFALFVSASIVYYYNIFFLVNE